MNKGATELVIRAGNAFTVLNEWGGILRRLSFANEQQIAHQQAVKFSHV
jgi:hypothetical protein